MINSNYKDTNQFKKDIKKLKMNPLKEHKITNFSTYDVNKEIYKNLQKVE